MRNGVTIEERGRIRRWNERTVNCAKRMKLFARCELILRRCYSTAH